MLPLNSVARSEQDMAKKKNGEVNDVRDRHKADVYLKRLVFSNLLVYCGVFHQNIPRKK